jgi:hypothetical protein
MAPVHIDPPPPQPMQFQFQVIHSPPHLESPPPLPPVLFQPQEFTPLPPPGAEALKNMGVTDTNIPISNGGYLDSKPAELLPQDTLPQIISRKPGPFVEVAAPKASNSRVPLSPFSSPLPIWNLLLLS